MAISKIIYKSSSSATPSIWMDATTATASADDIIASKTAMLADGVMTTGTGSEGGQQTVIDNIIGNVQFSSFENTTYTGSNLVLGRIPAIDITVENATGLAQSGGFNTKTTGIISIPKVTTCGASAQSAGLKAKVLYAPLMTNLGMNAYCNDCQNLIKLVLKTHPIANTSSTGSLRYATTNFKALVIKATTPPTLSDAALTRLRDYTGIGTNSDGYIYVPTSAYNDYISATNWSTISSKIRKIGDYPLIDAPTTWLPT